MSKRVLMLLSKGYWPDPRVEKEAGALVEAGYSVEVVCWDRSGKGPPREETKGFVLRRFRAGFSSRGLLAFSFLCFALKSSLIAIRSDFDVVHCHDLDTLPQGFLASWFRRRSLVYDAHEHYALMVREDVGVAVSQLFEWLECALAPRANLVIAVSDQVMSHLLPGVRGRSAVVMNCVDPGSLPSAELSGAERRKEWNDKLVVFYGGSLEPLRYIPELIEAVKKDDRVVLLLSGRGRYEGLVRDAQSSCDRIVYTGYVPQDEILRETISSDVVFAVYDPRNENNRIGTPVKVLEAMAMGVPVLVSKGTAIAEVVEASGAGLSLDWSEETFSKAVTRLQDPEVRRAMGERGKAAAESRYSWKEMKRRLLDAYSGL